MNHASLTLIRIQTEENRIVDGLARKGVEAQPNTPASYVVRIESVHSFAGGQLTLSDAEMDELQAIIARRSAL